MTLWSVPRTVAVAMDAEEICFLERLLSCWDAGLALTGAVRVDRACQRLKLMESWSKMGRDAILMAALEHLDPATPEPNRPLDFSVT